MNLVKAQAIANDLSPEMLQKYANGFDPRIIPPWIATGTLQAKMDLNKRMQNMTGGSQGEQPSIKEQIEQKAGLLAANAAQQQQAQQQMAAAPRPGPVPAGIPQPQAQPQPPMMMARGGLASVPVQFAFKPGGIVGYSGEQGSQVGKKPLDEAARRELQRAQMQGDRESLINVLQKLGAAGYDIGTLPFRAIAGVLDTAVVRPARAITGKEIPYLGSVIDTESMTPAMDVLRSEEPPVSPKKVDPIQVAEEAPSPPPPPPPPPPPRREPPPAAPAMQTGLPAAANRSQYFAQAEADMAKPIAAPTTQGIIDEQAALSPRGMQEAVMQQRDQERRARADEERATFNRTRPSGLDNAIRVFGQSGQFKGGTGFAPAYTANQDRNRAEEMAMQKRMNELYTAADTQEYESAKEIFGARSGAMKEANRSYQDRLKSRSETLAQLANTDQRSIDAVLDRLSEMEIQRLRMLESSKGTPDQQLFANFLRLKAEGKEAEAKVLLDSLEEFRSAGKNQTDEILRLKLKPIYKARVDAAGMLGDIGANKLKELDAMEQKILREAGLAGGRTETPTAAHISALKKNPSMAAEFDRKFGPGTSAQYIK